MNMFSRFIKARMSGFFHYVTLVFVALLLCGLPAAHADSIQDAHKLFKQGQHGQALEKVNAFLSSKPKDAQARFLKGLILTEQNKSGEAIKVFTALTEDYPELPEPYNNLAVLYASQGQYDKAKMSLEMAIRTHPSYATAHENLGDIYAKMASQAYDRALQLDRSNTATQTKLAMIQDLFAGGSRGKPVRGKAEPVVTARAEIPVPSKIEGSVPNKVEARVEVNAPEVASKVQSAKAEPAAAKPAPTAKAQQAPTSDEVMKSVNGWLAAWSAQDVQKYLSYYASDFKVPDGASRATWEALRQERINKPKSIKVSVASTSVIINDNEHVTVKFHQTYQASHLKISGDKTLQMVKSGTNWLIQEESAK